MKVRSISRRRFLGQSLAAGSSLLLPAELRARWADHSGPLWVNDRHSQLNSTRVHGIVPIASEQQVLEAIWAAHKTGVPLSVAGARHAAGGQQFCTNGTLLDTTPFSQVLSFDSRAGTIEVEPGIKWLPLLQYLDERQRGHARPWTIQQKQTGTNNLTVGGALSANVHGRQIERPPIAADVVSFRLALPDGRVVNCSRQKNRELFRLVIGGYGLFGILLSVKLRLRRRIILKRNVVLMDASDLVSTVDRLRQRGHLLADFQFSPNTQSPDFLRRGILTTFSPAGDADPLPPAGLSNLADVPPDHFVNLAKAVHTDPGLAWTTYEKLCLDHSGRVHTWDQQYVSTYVDDYHGTLDECLATRRRSTEVLGELYVPRNELLTFLLRSASGLRRWNDQLIYGVVRFIEPDVDTFLRWAKKPYACIIFNIHTEHSHLGVERTRQAFRRLYDEAIALGGSFYLTYQRFASPRQLSASYPELSEFLKLKARHDPHTLLRSDWYSEYSQL